MRACLQCGVSCFIYSATITQVILVFGKNHRGRENWGRFEDLHLYPLLAASLEIYSIYVKHETACGG